MKNKDLYKIKQILEKWTIHDNELSCIVSKNIKLVDTLLNTFNNFKIIDPTDYKLQKFKICNKYNKGFNNGKYIISNSKKFNEEMDDLDYNFLKTTEILNNSCTIIFYKIKKDHLPNNISIDDINELSFMIY
jgi:hypothetical protein